MNGTALHYYFFDRKEDGSQVRFTNGTSRFVTWVGAEAQRQVVRDAFQVWKDLGIGLEFREVSDRNQAEIRIGFMDFDGSWSYLGRGILQAGVNERTMNFGWDLTTPYGRTTALHEIGHTLGMPHEHQNPFTGIQWDEEAVYAHLGGPPNNWTRQQTFHNVLRKLNTQEVSGSTWDPNSVMEYSFPPGLILAPEKYRNEGISPPGTISPVDAEYIRQWYPPLAPEGPPPLKPFESVPLDLASGQQADFSIAPEATRDYTFGTFGSTDVVLVLFEQVGDELRYVTGDDDSGAPRNATLKQKLFQDRRYVLRMRLYSAWQSGKSAVMYW
ncbi:matrixin family metalloprotease [Rhizohabitans arisaemae]|uniref:matrixin family metalloprotease n=1 Tax=Rhizohabitans arisaemae TaxID=2720610 RepID=UPI0024B1C850|nr:matrixin family metalloprotease [Rhizohabitans arisaemae]